MEQQFLFAAVVTVIDRQSDSDGHRGNILPPFQKIILYTKSRYSYRPVSQSVKYSYRTVTVCDTKYPPLSMYLQQQPIDIPSYICSLLGFFFSN